MRSLTALIVLLASVASAAPCSELPVLFIVQDKSGSMTRAPDGSTATTANPSKWSIAQQVVPSLATNFANRFRFGVAMYPRDTTTFNCSTGTVVAPIAEASSAVQSAFAAAVPGGGTPTAASLWLVKNHLAAQGLTTPAHVLLITDGLPNCNTSLDANSCSPTTPGCGPTPAASSCALGSKDCLDSQATVDAAAALRQAGVKVFVVGFDSTLTAGNNKAVLDAIANAGGTGTAYTATSQAQLTSTLNTIALNTATCCKDVCTAGAAVCSSSGARQVCSLDAALGCTTWTTQACAAGTTCNGGSCQTCTNSCTPGAKRCANGDAQECVANAQGCTTWQVVDECGYGELCAGGACGTCQACTIGASECTTTGVRTCEWDVLSGCTTWKAGTCASGSKCQGGSCTSCNATCTAGATRCNGNGVETCVADASGCTRWQATQTCTNFCSGGACGTCGTSCAPGQTRCQGAGVETCRIDQNNCPAWGPAQQCAPNSVCQGGACAQCPVSCTQGSKRCGANGATETCELTATGCHAWVPSGQCDVGGGERCDQGVCIPPCANECAAGALRCGASGRPQSCQAGPTSCLIWRDEPACGSDQLCSEGVCRTRCSDDEFETCPAGLLCTNTKDGRFCMPENPGTGGGSGSGGGAGSSTGGGAGGGGGSSAAGGGTGSASGGGSGSAAGGGDETGTIGAQGMGCGCGAVDGGVLAGLAVVGLLRRRRRG
jgi:Mg-chelatase subunit ChlD